MNNLAERALDNLTLAIATEKLFDLYGTDEYATHQERAQSQLTPHHQSSFDLATQHLSDTDSNIKEFLSEKPDGLATHFGYSPESARQEVLPYAIVIELQPGEFDKIWRVANKDGIIPQGFFKSVCYSPLNGKTYDDWKRAADEVKRLPGGDWVCYHKGMFMGKKGIINAIPVVIVKTDGYSCKVHEIRHAINNCIPMPLVGHEAYTYDKKERVETLEHDQRLTNYFAGFAGRLKNEASAILYELTERSESIVKPDSRVFEQTGYADPSKTNFQNWRNSELAEFEMALKSSGKRFGRSRKMRRLEAGFNNIDGQRRQAKGMTLDSLRYINPKMMASIVAVSPFPEIGATVYAAKVVAEENKKKREPGPHEGANLQNILGSLLTNL